MNKIILLAVALLVAVAAQAGPYPEITVDQVKSAIDAKSITLLDVNGTQSWKQGHIPGAKSLPFAEMEKAEKEGRLLELLPKEKDKLLVFYCGGVT